MTTDPRYSSESRSSNAIRNTAFGLVFLSAAAMLPAIGVSEPLTAFPPQNCVTGITMYMGWDGVRSTTCNSGQDILRDTLGCSEGQHVVFESGRYTCKTIVQPPNCIDNEVLTYSGSTYSCVHTDIPTCAATEVLTFNGSGFICVAKTDSIPSCAPNEFLTYNNQEFQCASARQMTIPTCAEQEVLSTRNGELLCVPNLQSSIDTEGGSALTDTCDSPTSSPYVCQSNWYKDVVFAKPFTAPPVVMASISHPYIDASSMNCIYSGIDAFYVTATNVTKTGFRLVAWGSPAACGELNPYLIRATSAWIAVGHR